MSDLKHLLEYNARWSESVTDSDPGFFTRLVEQQAPNYLWIGCADSRVPANQIVNLEPGELFVHRNIANVVVHTDLNCLSVLQYAVDILQVEHVIVCGHYGCGGVAGAVADEPLGLIDNWLRHIEDVRTRHLPELDALADDGLRLRRLCELNVMESVSNVCRTTIVRDAWRRGQDVHVHGWIYGLRDGRLRDLDVSAGSVEDWARSQPGP